MSRPCHPSAFPLAVLAEASRIAPGRRTSSDGICGDPRHQAEVSDHNPDGRGIPHAVDISQSTPGNPYGDGTAPHNVFDAHAYGLLIAQRIIAGTEHRVKYLVSNYGHGDVIFDPAVSLTWRPNPTGDEHVSHLHVSFLYLPSVEQSTAPFFNPIPEDDVTPQDKIDIANDAAAAVSREMFAANPHHPGQHTGILADALKVYIPAYLNDPVWMDALADRIVAKLHP